MKTKEPIYDYLKRRLAEAEGRHREIARATGVPQQTVSRIHNGEAANPTLRVAQPLLDYFLAEEEALRRHRGRAASARRVSNAQRVRIPGRRSAAAPL